MVRSLLVRGMLAGLAAGVAAFAFAFLVGEPQVQAAIEFQERRAARAGEPAAVEVYSRDVQRTIGLLTASIALGVGFGGLLALVFAYAYGRVGIAGARSTAAALAVVAFATLTLVPFTKYPANPPAVGDPATIDERTLLSFAMIAIAALALLAAVRARARLAARLGAWDATVVAGGVFVAVIAVAQLILPAMDAAPPGFPADVLYRFRLASLGISATLWLVIGLAFGAAAERLLAQQRGSRSRRSLRVTGREEDPAAGR